MTQADLQRAADLLDAQHKAVALFAEIQQSLIRPGITEKALSNEIHRLAVERYGVQTHWHKQVIRSGPNTLRPFAENPPDRVIQPDDILYVDLGPVFEAWEADFGRTFVLGDDPRKHQLRDSLEPIFHAVRARFLESPEDVTGEELFEFAVAAAQEAGWVWGAEIAGHIVGSFPHERIPQDKTTLYITRGNREPMRRPGKDGLKRHWILEIHLHDLENGFGGFTNSF
ncbi:putative peptidase m24 protein [Aspergillus rambellii]|uniref:Putative peptidase m24 protein n=1 Tax=Aspergillus rambellii TaxID=308745 RepID=A0A0F8XTY7_9EURO|nr:putative peptidase m24 protein [Aspergillus rambellii]